MGGLDPVLLHTLQECGTLPRDLKGYRRSGDDIDLSIFVEKILGDGVEILVLKGSVYRKTVMDSMAWLLQPSVDVAVLLFCGHGVNEGSFCHDTLVCSYKQLVSAEAIDAVVRAQCFDGTLIRVLNTCESEWVAPFNQHGRSQRDAARTDHHKEVILSATGPFEETIWGKAGTPFIAALGRMFDAKPIVTYESLDELLKLYWPGGSGRVQLYPEGLKGVFGRV